MEILKDTIDPILKQKGLTIKQLCKDVGITEQGYHRAMRANSMRMSTYSKIKEYLGIEEGENNKHILSSSDETNEYWKGKYEESQKNVAHLLNTIKVLTLGKFNAVPFNPAYVFRR